VTVALVIDDDPDLRGVVVFMLARAGFEVHLESDGEAGPATAIRIRPDVVLLDWMMPGMSGVEVCRLLRGHAELSSMVVILLTAKAQESDVHSGFDAGVDDYIVKPFSPKELVIRVLTAIERVKAESL
jgi:DNA-binding response OmpR family regulator